MDERLRGRMTRPRRAVGIEIIFQCLRRRYKYVDRQSDSWVGTHVAQLRGIPPVAYLRPLSSCVMVTPAAVARFAMTLAGIVPSPSPSSSALLASSKPVCLLRTLARVLIAIVDELVPVRSIRTDTDNAVGIARRSSVLDTLDRDPSSV